MRLGAVAEGLLSPLRWPSVDLWWRDTEPRMQALFPGANVLLSIPSASGTSMAHHSESIDEGTRRHFATFHERDAATGRLTSCDTPLQLWYDYRALRRISVWNEVANARDLERMGTHNDACLWYTDGLVPGGLRDYSGMTSEHGSHELFLCFGYNRHGLSRHGFDAEHALLAALLPAFRAGHHALVTLGSRQAALTATLDAVPDALMVVAGDGRELHRNSALRRRLADDPERERLAGALRQAAAALRLVPPTRSTTTSTARGRGMPAAASVIALPTAGATLGEQRVTTTHARYVIHAAFGADEIWGTSGTVLVSLACAPNVEHVLPADRLTAREREVAGLLARRMTDDEVAATLGISWHTARRHTERVLQKVGVRSRRELAAALSAVGVAAPSGAYESTFETAGGATLTA